MTSTIKISAVISCLALLLAASCTLFFISRPAGDIPSSASQQALFADAPGSPVAVQARAIRSVGRCIASLISATRTGVSAAAIHVPAIQSCEVTAAAEADATLAMVSVRVFRRRSSSRSAERVAGGMRTRQGSD